MTMYSYCIKGDYDLLARITLNLHHACVAL